MPSLPIMLNIQAKRCVIIGGGPVALRRAGALLDADARVTVIAPDIDPGLAELAVELRQRPYQPGDLDGAVLVVVASDDPKVNTAVAQDARRAGVLVNRADDPTAGDFIVPAHAHHGPITLAVHTGGTSAAASAIIRRELSDALDPDWPRLIQAASAFRSMIQERVPDPKQRRQRLKQLTDPHAMAILKQQGEAALRDYYQTLTKTTP